MLDMSAVLPSHFFAVLGNDITLVYCEMLLG